MDYNKVFIAEAFHKTKEKGKTITKRIGYKAFYYSNKFNTYISLSNREEYVLESHVKKIGTRYIKEKSIIPYTNFAPLNITDKEKAVYIKNKIIELSNKRLAQSKKKEIDKKSSNTKWLKNYKLALSYFICYGNLEVPQDFITQNGVSYDDDGIKLGNWICLQRQNYKHNKLNEEQIELLNKIGMRFSKIPKEDIWLTMYNLLKEYYQKHGNLDVPLNFITTNGYEYNISGYALGKWLQIQKGSYIQKNNGNLTNEQIKLLENLKIIWYDKEHDVNFQKEVINEKNQSKKKNEMLNRLYSLLNQYDLETMPSKKQVNQDYMRMLNRKDE